MKIASVTKSVGEVNKYSINCYAQFPFYKGFQWFSDRLTDRLLEKPYSRINNLSCQTSTNRASDGVNFWTFSG